MKKYTSHNYRWKENKALWFFLNFIINHKGPIEDNDSFELVATLRTHAQWIDLIKATYPKTTLNKMKHSSSCRNRLDFDDDAKEMFREIWYSESGRNRLRKLFASVISDELEKHPIENDASEPFAQKVRELQQTMKLTDFEVDVLLVFAFLRSDLLCMSDGRCGRSDQSVKQEFVAKCLNCDPGVVREALRNDHKIRRYDCVDDDLDFNSDLFCFLCGASKEPLTNSYYTRCHDEVLPWSFYGNLSEKHGDMLKKIISSANNNMPTNILLYGAPGTGKTSFAKTLAAELKRDCYMISQDVSMKNGTSRSTPEHRFGALHVCAEQVDPAESLIIVDEADDMLRSHTNIFALLFGGSQTTGDKGLLNSVLDTVRVPTIWITNTPAGALDESSRRRFDYSIRFDPLNTTQRLAIWRNNVSKMKLEHLFSDAMQNKFAASYPVSAGGITLTLQNIAKLSPKPDEVEALVAKLIAPHCELLNISQNTDKLLPAKDYSLEGLNIKGNLSLDRIVDAIRNYQQGNGDAIDRPRMNLLLSGAPGTGKTEFVKYLGNVLKTKVNVKMGSDLLSMWVGGTEQNIARAFREAEAEHAILFLDEIDGLVQSRTNAHRSWEVTQVNELLHQMENFNGVMIGATNFIQNLDQAIMRRFTFKLQFNYLDDAGKELFFERMFHCLLSPEAKERLHRIPNLAPGDFRTVRQSLFYYGGEVTNAQRLDALEREAAAKTGGAFAVRGKMGF